MSFERVSFRRLREAEKGRSLLNNNRGQILPSFPVALDIDTFAFCLCLLCLHRNIFIFHFSADRRELARMAASPSAFCGRLTDEFAAAAATFSGDARDALLSQGRVSLLLPALETRISPFIGLKKQIGDHLFLIYTTPQVSSISA